MCHTIILYFFFPVTSTFALVFRWIASVSLSQKTTWAKTDEPYTSTPTAPTS